VDSRNIERRKMLKYFLKLRYNTLHKLGNKTTNVNIKMQFICSPNGGGSEKPKSIKKSDILQHHVDIQAM